MKIPDECIGDVYDLILDKAAFPDAANPLPVAKGSLRYTNDFDHTYVALDEEGCGVALDASMILGVIFDVPGGTGLDASNSD